jgi:hypothetical protein
VIAWQVKAEASKTQLASPTKPQLPALPTLMPLKLARLPDVPEIKSTSGENDEEGESPGGSKRRSNDHDHREHKEARDRHAHDHNRADVHGNHKSRSGTSAGSGSHSTRRHAVPGERVWSGLLCKTHSPDVRAIAIHMSGASIKGMVPAQLDIVGRMKYDVSTWCDEVCKVNENHSYLGGDVFLSPRRK